MPRPDQAERRIGIINQVTRRGVPPRP